MSGDRVLVVGDGPELGLVEGGGTAEAIVWPGVGARLRALHRFRLEPGARTREQRHPGEAVYGVVSGAGEVVDGAAGVAQPVATGAMIHIEAGTPYVITAGEEGLELAGGPAPVDPTLYAHLDGKGA